MKQVIVRNEKTTKFMVYTFPTEEAAKSYIVGAVHGKTVANNLEIPVNELKEQIKNRKGLRLGNWTWDIV